MAGGRQALGRKPLRNGVTTENGTVTVTLTNASDGQSTFESATSVTDVHV